MSDLHQSLHYSTRRVVTFQVGAVLLAAIGFYFSQELSAAIAAICGGVISVVSTLQLSYSVRKASAMAATDPTASMRTLYVGAVQRFVAVLLMFGIAIANLKLQPLALFAGFALGQAGYFFSAHQMNKKEKGS